MKKLLFLVLVAVAAWYGWHHYGDVLYKRPSHEAVVENRAGHEMTRVRLSVDGQTFVKESIPDGADAVFPFRVSRDASFQLVWQWGDGPAEQTWSGGMVPRGPMLQRHILSVDTEGAVLYRAENK
jgi:hypothetical protein